MIFALNEIFQEFENLLLKIDGFSFFVIILFLGGIFIIFVLFFIRKCTFFCFI